ncbi:hypothetical protein MKW94_016300 [Papaver nudicaule]|uniref:Uncharacterized protein n=1 Tax=Papaver nudicaule TaxID=74823 RepID=A0AA41RNV4_PAPNU|nr:hypothetical protein [Papaver nudicaule]MCL7047882.1 hypothetical protein [Papaver nudicaule]
MGRPIGIGFLLILSLFFFSLLISTVKSSQELEEAAARTLGEEHEDAHKVHCSRERSRAAWKIIEEYLMPFVEQEQYQISSRCRLHPDNDLFRDQEQHKIHMDINEWKCGYCKKKFPCRESHSKCLADLCGALHCDHVMEFKQSKKTKCNPAAASRNRHLCESLANNCFPTNASPSASRLHELFLRQFCDAHTCTGGAKPFARGRRKSAGIFYIAISILTLMLLPLFYVIVYLYHREMKMGIQDLKRISKIKQKTKPS